ncbi:hypothetical protein [Roseinatronobacter sp.]|uniref:hypothetical protein n=1 Tax=Roseinatronobacter sp. TaxID=1945755 RepID=UPI002601513B|nr:hypothetical protein [Rhodobaca sp.]
MFRLFDLLGRSSAVRALDDAFRASGMHPLLVPEPVKLTVIQLTKKHGSGNQPTDFAQAAHLMAYCILGHEQFTAHHGASEAELLDLRVENALEHGSSLDAKVILLALHSGLISPEITDRIDLEED